MMTMMTTTMTTLRREEAAQAELSERQKLQ
jgi:hypothetical protein